MGKTSGRKRRGIVWDKRRCNLNGRKKGITMNEARRERERVRKKIERHISRMSEGEMEMDLRRGIKNKRNRRKD